MLNLIGFLLPPLIDLINRKVLNKDVRFWISVLICGTVGVVLNYVTNSGELGSIESIIDSMFLIFGMAQLSYKAVWENNSKRVNLGLRADNTPDVTLPDLE